LNPHTIQNERQPPRRRRSCGQLTARVTGVPVRVSVCHCLACQRRTGSVFGAQRTSRARTCRRAAWRARTGTWEVVATTTKRFVIHEAPAD
jgi:hypothetical protein